MARQTEAERLREHRLIFERARRERISMIEARNRFVRDRWAAIDARLAARRGSIHVPGQKPVILDEHGADVTDRLMWWQR